jgi:hypothetical protein
MYIPNICKEYLSRLDHELENLLSPEQIDGYKSKANMAVQILATQSRQIHNLYVAGYIDGFHLHRFHQIIQELYAEQGRGGADQELPFPTPVGLHGALDHPGVLRTGPVWSAWHIGSSNGHPSWLPIPFSGLIIWFFS